MGIYDLNNSSYLKHDIEDTLSKIDAIYVIKNEDGKPFFVPKTIILKSKSWVSPEAQEAFNKLVPPIKSLTKDMYALLENIFKSEKGKFDKPQLEKEYPHLKELRLLNNKFKHLNDKESEITLTSLVLMDAPFGNLIDAYINFKYPEKLVCLRFSDLVLLYLKILEDLNILKINLN
jgi:hypothetical protein